MISRAIVAFQVVSIRVDGISISIILYMYIANFSGVHRISGFDLT